MVQAVRFEASARLVTMDDPTASPQEARGAFARLRPPPDHPAQETASWRNLVAAEAIAVRVLPAPRSAMVTTTSTGVVEPVDNRGLREEATAMAAETGDPEVVMMVERALSEAGA